MKARIEGGKIIKYNQVPETVQGNDKHYLNFRDTTDAEKELAGFYDVVVPDYDPVTQSIHNLHFDDNYDDGNGGTRSVFTYDVKDKVISETVAELKTKRIKELDSLQFEKLSPTDFYVWRKSEKGTAIPSDVQTERDNIRASAQTKEDEINALTTKAAILKYDISF